MKIAYLISAHSDPAHLYRLVGALQPAAAFFIHVDAKVDLASFARVLNRENVHFIAERYDVRWGEISQVYYQRALLRAALDSGQTFDRLFTLSGLDYPVWGNARIRQFFAEHPHTEYICGIDMTDQRPDIQRTYRMYRPWPGLSLSWTRLRTFIRARSRKLLWLFGCRKPLTVEVAGSTVPLRLHKGGSWWCITPQLARYLLDTLDNHPELLAYFRTSFGPDETLWQTLVFNSPYAGKALCAQGDYTTLADLTPLHHIYYHPVIKVFTLDDLPDILSSGRMFCRKTMTGVSDGLMDRLDALRRAEDAALPAAT